MQEKESQTFSLYANEYGASQSDLATYQSGDICANTEKVNLCSQVVKSGEYLDKNKDIILEGARTEGKVLKKRQENMNRHVRKEKKADS